MTFSNDQGFLALRKRISKEQRIEEQTDELLKANEKLENHRKHLEEMVRERTDKLQKTVNLLAGREMRMVELKETIRKLRAQLEEEGLAPMADDPLREGSDQ
jgi:peptidoglycan hydrolase CwlO-like protein